MNEKDIGIMVRNLSAMRPNILESAMITSCRRLLCRLLAVFSLDRGLHYQSDTDSRDQGHACYWTVRIAVSLTPLSSAEMVDVPDKSALARPILVIVATWGSDDPQVT